MATKRWPPRLDQTYHQLRLLDNGNAHIIHHRSVILLLSNILKAISFSQELNGFEILRKLVLLSLPKLMIEQFHARNL